MRLWHFALIKFLPRQQLLSQWRECVCIAKSIRDKGIPNHILVNKIMDYPIGEFNIYCNIVLSEMLKRRYNVSEASIHNLEDYAGFEVDSREQYKEPFPWWHTPRYLDQCMSNLEEKFDCGGVSTEEWTMLCEGYKKITGHSFKEDGEL